jgi:hypothetical protein
MLKSKEVLLRPEAPYLVEQLSRLRKRHKLVWE